LAKPKNKLIFVQFFSTSSSQKNNINNKLEELKPIITYFNADTQKMQILQENKGKSGIYR
jgi:hypothetical protein